MKGEVRERFQRFMQGISGCSWTVWSIDGGYKSTG
jgi:hypothetical protein